MKTALTGIKPSSTPHLGNYLGAIRPALGLTSSYRALYFIADYHALTSLRDPNGLERYTYDVAATWLACGLDPQHVLLFRQSDGVEVFEMSWILSCLVAAGQLERGHAYKDALNRNEAPTAGVLFYPVLMAADILVYDTDVIPVGKDQKQHLEVARDLAVRLNHAFGEGVVRVPEPLVTDMPLVPGTDGRKMSKSSGNAIPLFASSEKLRKAIMSIKTSSEGVTEAKDPEKSTVFQIYRQVASQEKGEEMAQALRAGQWGWGQAKEALFEALESEFGGKRQIFADLRSDQAYLDAVLQDGAARARVIAGVTMERVRMATGIGRHRYRTRRETIPIPG